MTHPTARALLAAATACLLAAALPAQAAEQLTLYTTREPGLIQPLIAAFSAQTNIQVNTVFVKDGLLERVKAEGTRSPADPLMTVDIGTCSTWSKAA